MSSYHSIRKSEKAVQSLLGILSGLVADKTMNSNELLFLDMWLKSHKELHEDADVIDILDITSSILSNKSATEDELMDLKDLCSDILSHRRILESDVNSINHFLGLCIGCISDGKVNQQEFKKITLWIESNKHLSEQWPISAISERVSEILKDNFASESELSDFAETLKLITGFQFLETGDAESASTEFIFDNVDDVVFEGQAFCFTGKFISAPRGYIEDKVATLGAELKSSVSAKLNYLVVGLVGSKDWMYSSHGRKIEQALQLKQNGSEIKIISERALWGCSVLK